MGMEDEREGSVAVSDPDDACYPTISVGDWVMILWPDYSRVKRSWADVMKKRRETEGGR